MLLQQCSVFTSLDIRSRHEEAINSTWNRRSSILQDIYFYLFLNLFSTRVSDNLKYVYSRRLYGCKKYTKIQGPWFQRNYIIARILKSDLHGMSLQSLPKINCLLITIWPFAYNERLQHPTIAVLLKVLIFFPPLSSVYLFKSNQRFQAIEFVDRHVLGKLLI